MANKAFVEITNICNLACSFCHGTKRPPRMMTRREFERAASELRPFCEYIYFHLLGEPLLHPLLGEFFDIAGELGFKVIITTNGTLLNERAELLLGAGALHKVSISLHSFEANDRERKLGEYLDMCFDFCRLAADRGIIAVMRLWNEGGEQKLNEDIISRMHEYFRGEWKQIYSGYKLCERVFLEWGEHFEWPDMDASVMESGISCYGARDQIGVLCDGTVVPCCLDAEGDISLGNIYTDTLGDILASDRATALKRSFERRCVTEPLCLRCGYSHQKRYR